MSIAGHRRRRERATARTAESTRIEALLKREAPALLAYFQRRVRPTEDAADLLSEMMLVAWRRAAAVPTEDQQARMWLFGVARNLLSTHRRGQHRRDALATELRAELTTRPNHQRSSHQVDDSRVERLEALIDQVPELDREILTLAVWDGMTLAEVATLLNMPAGTVRSRYSRIRATLRTQLEAEQEPSGP